MTTSRVRTSFVLVGLVVIVSASLSAPSAGQAIYRCEQGGKVTYTDAPCAKPVIQEVEGELPNSAPRTQKVVSGGYTTPYGPWSGQTQFQIMNTNVLQSDGTHFIAFTELMIGEDGKVTGGSAENSCRLLGLASPGFAPTMLNLDVTLSNCPAKLFNRRYHGTLIMNPKQRTAQMSIRALQIGIGQAVNADIKATLAR